MMTTYKVLTIITFSLLTVCATNKKMLKPKQERGEPRFIRHDIPMNFKRGHNYPSTVSPIEPAELVASPYQNLQYAPLHGRISHRNKNAAAEYTKVTPTLSAVPLGPTEPFQSNVRSSYAKAHLEPRIVSGQLSDTMKCYNPGYNMDIFSSVSRSPGHNAVYRDLTGIIPSDKFKEDYLIPKPFGYPNAYPLTTTMMPFDLPETVAKPFSIPSQHYVLNPNILDTGSEVEKIKRQYSPFAKLHRLHLNIARVYSPGQTPPKSPAFADTYSLNFGRLPVHSQAYIPPVFQALPVQKTLLFPIKNNQKIFHVRMAENIP
ncbi:uncharacterized protein LOC135116716 [Helicoverpa armigera]|uniref:uncharacterized protein LOC135116716 n=1 Tax=Helicoverpa armigera TaxID=29058 RepID=UPI003082F323